MLVAGTQKSVLSIINGRGKWIEIAIEVDPIYQTTPDRRRKGLLAGGQDWRDPGAVRLRAPETAHRKVRVVDMNASNSWAEFTGLFCQTQQAHADHERAKTELKGLMPEDAKEAMGHGIRAKRSKSGAVSFDLVEMEASHASVQ